MAVAKGSEDNVQLTGAAGISPEDQQDIFRQIELVAAQNRIQVGPELMAVKASKRGLLVPLLVNFGGLLVLAIGLFTLYFVFRQTEEVQAGNRVVVQSAEGKVLEELKKQAESQLVAKDKELAEIQAQMAALNKERNDLRANMDAKVASKETELRQKLQQELETERKRLQDAGFSQAKIEEKLREFEKQKNAEFQKELAAFQKKAEEDRQAHEAELKKQAAENQKKIDDLAALRQKIVNEAKQKQADIQAELDKKNSELQNLKAAANQELGAAQAELGKLNDQKARTASAENQISGLMMKVSQAIQGRRYPEAIKVLASLVEFLDQDVIRTLPDLQRRRESDLFLANTLTDLLTREQARLEAEARKTEAPSGPLEAIKAAAVEAEQALSEGRTAAAEAAYNKALNLIPEVLAGHQYFLDKVLTAEKRRQQVFVNVVSQADAALGAGRFEESLNLYGQALDYLPLEPDRRDALIARYAQAVSGADLAANEKDLSAAVAQAQALQKKGQTAEAFEAWLVLLDRDPKGKTLKAVTAGLREASAALKAANLQTAELTNQMDGLQAALTKLQTQADAAVQEKIAVEKERLALQEQLKSALAERDALAAKNASQAAALAAKPVAAGTTVGPGTPGAATPAATGPAAANAPITDAQALAKIAELERKLAALQAAPAEDPKAKADTVPLAEYQKAQDEIKRLTPFATNFTQIQKIFQEFTANDDKLDKNKSADVMKSRVYISSFLRTPEVSQVFPDLAKRLQANDKAAQDLTLKESLVNVNEVLARLVQLESKTEKKGYVDSLLKRYTKDAAMTQFLTTLLKTL